MAPPTYRVARLEEIEELDDGREPFRPVRHDLGITAFGATSWTARAAGDRIINEHDEADGSSEELYLVLQGHAVFELDGDRVDAPAGTFVFAPPEVKRTAFAEEAGTTIVVVGATVGKAYDARGWELWAPLWPRYEAGEHAEVAERLRPLVEAHPQYPLLFFNLACCESLTGRSADALEHLRRAVELSDEFLGHARTDSDLDAIRDEPAFQELIGTDPSPESPVSGSCLCGGVRFEVTAPFRWANHCHCSRCRKHSGAFGGTQGRVPRGGFRLVAGEELISVFRPDGGRVKAFCSACGSSLFGGEWPDGDEVSIRLGSLDGDAGIRPQFHTFVASRAAWETIPDDGLPRYDEAHPDA